MGSKSNKGFGPYIAELLPQFARGRLRNESNGAQRRLDRYAGWSNQLLGAVGASTPTARWPPLSLAPPSHRRRCAATNDASLGQTAVDLIDREHRALAQFGPWTRHTSTIHVMLTGPL
jgi:hypothetical protein